MKKEFIYLAVIVILTVFLLVQSTFNQPKYNFKTNDQNEIGRYQYFDDPDGTFGGFLDTKEGFVFLYIGRKWETWDLKSEFESAFLNIWRKDAEWIDTSIVADTVKKKFMDKIEREFDSRIQRIW